jgi:iron-sulfur cluster repair protein YtfE (RIC family)
VLHSIGKREEASDAVELLLACHERIRRFLTLARTLATAHGASDDEIRGTAAQVRRYFAEALPLHVADEHEDIVPRLAGAGGEVARALATMDADHELHAPIVARLVELCDALVRDPGRLAELSDELGRVAHELTDELGRHLDLEEQVILPALRELPAAELDALRTAMRARRGS